MEQVPTERRRRTDALIVLLRVLNAAAVLSLVGALFITAAAKPSHQSFFDQFHNLRIYYDWNYPLLRYAAFCLFLGFLSSSVGLLVNSRRLRRKGDHVHASLVVCMIVSAIGLILYFNNVLS